jgi:tellurite resistance protein TehA-like permease
MNAGCGRAADAGSVLVRAACRAKPVCFAMVMATGIVSVALQQAGAPSLSAALLVIAAAVFVVLVAASAVRAVAFPVTLRADLGHPDQAFTSFAFVAACGVLGDRLADGGYRLPAAGLAGAALAAWLVLTCLVPARLAARRLSRLADVNGTWYLWAVGTQSLAITAAFLHSLGMLPAGPAALAAITAWSAGIVVYLVITVLVARRLLLVGVGPQEATNPYWVAMGAASISVLAAAGILRIAGAPAVAARAHAAAAFAAAAYAGLHPAITGLAVALWFIATVLIPLLAAATAARYLHRPVRPRYRVDMWTVVFPLGMYSMAGMQLGTAAGLPLVYRVGAVAVPVATAAWALTIIGLAASPFTRRHASEDRSETMSRYDVKKREPAGPGSATGSRRAVTKVNKKMRRYKYQALVRLAPHDGGSPEGTLRGPACRMVVRARHHDTGGCKLFSALITSGDIESAFRLKDEEAILRLEVLGEDVCDYLAPGQQFDLWRGGDVGHGVVCRRLFV